MKDKTTQRKKFIINVLFFILAAAIIYFSVKYVLGWILPFIIGFFVALLLRPAMQFLSMKLRIPQKVSSVILVLLFYAVVSFLIILIGTKIVLILSDAFNNLPDMYTKYIAPLIVSLFEQLRELTARVDPQVAGVIENTIDSFSDSMGSVISTLSSSVLVALSSTVTSVPGTILFILLSIISSVFFAADYSRITGYITNILPKNIRSHMTTLKSMSADLGFKYAKSYTILLLITFAELTIGLLILGINNALALAALIAFIDLLPVLGTGAVLIPWGAINLLMGDYFLGIGILVLYVVILVVRQVLEPRIVGRQIGVHPLAMLVSMYVGLKVFGFVGIFILPIILLIVRAFREQSTDPDDTSDPDGSDADGSVDNPDKSAPERTEPTD